MLAPNLDYDEELHWLALKMAPGLGAKRAVQLIEQFRTPQAVFRASAAELQEAGLPGSVARSIASGCSFDDAATQHEKLARTGTVLIPIRDPLYPARLKETYDPPLALFAQGRVELLQTTMLGVVGTRRPTPYGLAVAERFGGDLAQARATIVSGMARGIDTAAHRGALQAGGNTIAVFGCGIDHIYPAENKRLAAEIAQKGLIISEFPLGAPAHPQNFPTRNRIISGMSAGVLVVEGAQYSGSAITAKLAMEQGREVFAVPGNITSRMSWGPNLLIKQGAKLVQDWNDVIADLPVADRRQLARQCEEQLLAASAAGEEDAAVQTGTPPAPAGKLHQDVLQALRVDRVLHLDEVMDKLEHYPSSEVIAALFELEMRGLIQQRAGKNFVKVW